MCCGLGGNKKDANGKPLRKLTAEEEKYVYQASCVIEKINLFEDQINNKQCEIRSLSNKIPHYIQSQNEPLAKVCAKKIVCLRKDLMKITIHIDSMLQLKSELQEKVRQVMTMDQLSKTDQLNQDIRDLVKRMEFLENNHVDQKLSSNQIDNLIKQCADPSDDEVNALLKSMQETVANKTK